MSQKPEISIIIPCLNEELALEKCIRNAHNVSVSNHFSSEIIVVDNGSTDASVSIIKKLQHEIPFLVLVHQPVRGYGNAYMAGLSSAQGDYIYMSDGDGTYDFSHMPEFISKLKAGNDMVIGNRFAFPMEKNSMPWLHRYIGNPLLSSLVRLFFTIKIKDIHCGARALRKTVLKTLSLNTAGMEFASEMIIKGARRKLSFGEVPITYSARIGTSKLNSFSDGWRHLRFILLYSPLYLFFLPGLIAFVIGILSLVIFYATQPTIFGITFFFHPMFLSSALVIVGYQLIIFSMFSKIYAITHLGDSNPKVEKLFKVLTIEKVALVGIVTTIIGAVIFAIIFLKWAGSGFDTLNEIKNSIVALTMLVIGIQTFFSGFMLSTLGIKET
jgi:glycosyltransferase involved in cell wall biosynthesis